MTIHLASDSIHNRTGGFVEPKKIFIVEQTTTERVAIRRTIEAAFKHAGIPCQFQTFETVEEAAACYDRDGPPHLILCDKDSEDEDAGIRLLRHVRRTGSPLPFILWGKHITDDHRESARQLSAVVAVKNGQNSIDFVCREAVQLLRGFVPRPH